VVSYAYRVASEVFIVTRKVAAKRLPLLYTPALRPDALNRRLSAGIYKSRVEVGNKERNAA